MKICSAWPVDCTMRVGSSPPCKNDSVEPTSTLQTNWYYNSLQPNLNINKLKGYTQLCLGVSLKLTQWCTKDNHWYLWSHLSVPEVLELKTLHCHLKLSNPHWKFPRRTFGYHLAAFPFGMFELRPANCDSEYNDYVHVCRDRKNSALKKTEELRIPLDTNLGCIEHCISAIRKDTDRPRWQVIVHVIEHHSRGWLCVIVCKKSCTISGFWRENMSLEKPNIH